MSPIDSNHGFNIPQEFTPPKIEWQKNLEDVKPPINIPVVLKLKDGTMIKQSFWNTLGSVWVVSPAIRSNCQIEDEDVESWTQCIFTLLSEEIKK